LRRALAAVVLLALAGAPARAGDDPKVPPLTEETFATLRDRILPTEAECAFESIPWKPSFWDAVVEAQGAERPILLWAMNGHPLGCT
jgi:hypothetical protein